MSVAPVRDGTIEVLASEQANRLSIDFSQADRRGARITLPAATIAGLPIAVVLPAPSTEPEP
jgi:hypothetical protein